jgi:hypothetical protein
VRRFDCVEKLYLSKRPTTSRRNARWICTVCFTRTLLEPSMVGLRDNAQWKAVSLLAVVRSYCARSIPASACFTHKKLSLVYFLSTLSAPSTKYRLLFDSCSRTLKAALTPLPILHLFPKHPQQSTINHSPHPHHGFHRPSSFCKTTYQRPTRAWLREEAGPQVHRNTRQRRACHSFTQVLLTTISQAQKGQIQRPVSSQRLTQPT